MGRLKLQMQITIDGMNPDGPDREVAMDEVRDYSLDLLESAGTIILGSKTAAEFIPAWDRTAEEAADNWYEVGKLISGAKKVVFSQAADLPAWKNTVVERGELAPAVQKLKRETTSDILVYGGVSFVRSLVSLHLIDEFHLFVNPVAQGNGRSIFSDLQQPEGLSLHNAIALKNGLVLVQYEPATKA